MIAFHGVATLRDATLAQMQAHVDADAIVRGYGYWSDGKGCAVGCLTHDSGGGHSSYPTRWGIPEVLAHLEDQLFENLPLDEARLWPMRFLAAIPLGAELAMVWPRFALALLSDCQHGVRRLTREGSPQRAGVDGVARLFERQIAGDQPTTEEWRVAAAYAAAAVGAVAAYEAAAYAAYAAAADAFAAAAAPAVAAYAYADAAAAAAAAADAAAPAPAARRAHYSWMSQTLLSLLASAPVLS
jgi:hypothetical protein